MNMLLIIGMGILIVGAITLIVARIVVRRLDRWADAMILSFGMRRLLPPQSQDVPVENDNADEHDDSELLVVPLA